MTLLGRTACFDVAERALAAAARAGAEQAEVVLQTEDSGLTRYAADRIHQQIVERNLEVRLRVVVGAQVAVATSNQVDAATLDRLAQRAGDMARQSRADPWFPGLPEPPASPYPEATTFYQSTAQAGAAERAAAVRQILGILKEGGAEGYGVVTSGVTELCVANSRGVRAYQAGTDAWISVIGSRAAAPSSAGTASGYAGAAHRDWAQLDPDQVATEALARAEVPPAPRLAPGRYTVLLEDEAVAELLLFLASNALNGLDYLEGRSLYSGRLGEPRYPPAITLRDDPADPRGASSSFDYEGVPKAPLTLIDQGRPQEVAWDSATARRAGRLSTGHGLPAPNPYGPMPLHLSLQPGGLDRPALLRLVDRGLLVTRLHYVNVMDEPKTLLTGMTRDGTFLIEGGEIVGAVQNLRWIESIDNVLARCIGLGRQQRLISSGPGYGIRSFNGFLMPALVTEGFNITGSADQ